MNVRSISTCSAARAVLLLVAVFGIARTSFSQVMDSPVALSVTLYSKSTNGNWHPEEPENGTAKITFYGDSGTSTTSVRSDDTDISVTKVVSMKPGKEYTVVLGDYTVWANQFTISAPHGYKFYISGKNGSNLVERTRISTSGNGNGTYKVRVDVANDAKAVAVSSSIHPYKPLWSVGLGQNLSGSAAGSVKIAANALSDLSFEPSDLIYSSENTDVSVVLSAGDIRQIVAPQSFLDVVDTGTDKYELRFYPPEDMGSFNSTSGTYGLAAGASAFAVYEVSKVTGVTNSLKVKLVQDGATWTTSLRESSNVWTLYDWADGTDEVGDSIRKVVTNYSNSGSLHYYDVKEYAVDANGNFPSTPNTRMRKTLTAYSWGKELTKTELGYLGTTPLVTNYEYYTSPTNGAGHYQRLKKVTAPNGGYTRYTYYNTLELKGMAYEVFSPFEDTQEGRKVVYSYSSDGSNQRYFVSDKKTYISGYQIGREVNLFSPMTIASKNATKTVTRSYSSSSSYLETESVRFREDVNGFYRGRPHYIKRADGTMTSYAYDEDFATSGTATVSAIEGVSSTVSGATQLTTYGGYDIKDLYVVQKRSTMAASMIGDNARLSEVSSEVWTGSQFEEMIAHTLDYDDAGRVTKKSRSSGNFVEFEASYERANVVWEKDAVGVERFHSIDGLGRVSMTTKSDKSKTGVGAIGELYTSYLYSGLGNVAEVTKVGQGSSEEIVSSWVYDQAGRITSKTKDCCDTVTYTYPATDQVRTQNADGGYVLEDRFRDGSVASRTGDATIPFYSRSRYYSGYFENWTALESFSVGQYKDGWRVTRYDWLGRQVLSKAPSDTAYTAWTLMAYNPKGQLESVRRTRYETSGDIVAPYLYTYDEFGEILLEGADLDNDGLEVNSTDRIVDRKWSFVNGGNVWYLNSNEKVYATSTGGPASWSGSYTSVGGYDDVISRVVNFRNLASVPSTISDEVVVEVVDRANAYATQTSSTHSLQVQSGVVTQFQNPSNAEVEHFVGGVPVRVSLANGGVRTVEYDHLGRVLAKNGRDEVREQYSYKSGTRRIEYTYMKQNAVGGASITKSKNTYSNARLSQQLRYNSYGNEIVDYEYDKLGNVTGVSGSGTNNVDWIYDSYGRMTEQKQYRNTAGTSLSKVTWQYDDSTLLLKSKSHYDGTTAKTESYTYNELGLLGKRTAARTNTYTDYTYSIGLVTSTGDLSSIVHSDATPTVTYASYDRMGRATTITDVTGTRTLTYDENEGLSLGSESFGNNFYGSGVGITYDYEGFGANTYPGRYSGLSMDGVDWIQTYDTTTGRISGIGAGDKNFVLTYDDDSDHLLKVQRSTTGTSYDYSQERTWESWREKMRHSYVKWGSSSTIRSHYEMMGVGGNPPAMTLQMQTSSVFLRDDGADSLAREMRSGGTGDIQYVSIYDSLGQVTSWGTSRTAGTEATYSWDEAGNPTSYDGTSFTPNSLNQISAFGYDDDGNLTSDSVWQYSYDANNRLVSMMSSSLGRSLEFAYDYMGRRVEKKYWTNASKSGTPNKQLRFAYQGMELIAEFKLVSGNWVLSKSYHWGLDLSDTRGGAGGAMGLLMWRDHLSGEDYYPSYDLNGNVTGLLDDSGDYVAWYEYDAFGKVPSGYEGGLMKDDNPIRFSTQYTDDETGLVYYGFRYYDPSKGRFLNRDPIGEAGGLNLYQFIGNDPVNRVDKWGLCNKDDPEDCDTFELDPFEVPLGPRIHISGGSGLGFFESDSGSGGGGGDAPDDGDQKDQREKQQKKCDQLRAEYRKLGDSKIGFERRRNDLRNTFRHYDKNKAAKALFAGMSAAADILEGASPQNIVDLGQQYSKSTNRGQMMRNAAARLATNARQGMSSINVQAWAGNISTGLTALGHVTDLMSTGKVDVPGLFRDTVSLGAARYVGGMMTSAVMLPGDLIKSHVTSSDTKMYIGHGIPLEIQIEGLQSMQDQIFKAFEKGGECEGY